ncbi:hypothetical protein DFJ58DRAFT_847964 [Suillus subalutaceus]|uniref:uncharacterized protein n=1 Tax=Suillus subalutaceus TaxID=48586 RepID=UPI001B88251E|nr:uncharacterized protein DFJ58DRAFT_847964 [Suillus subalutaceus]KAG1832630.1 hypothetical protein DFJ58DRAFT_847964 [Suillus subalutaceus]
MDSRENITDKARRLQDEQIKTNSNFFLTWDQWVPPKLGPTRSFPQENLPVGFKYSFQPNRSPPTRAPNNNRMKVTPSTMPVRKETADALTKKHFGKEVFDMCWSTEAAPKTSVETPTTSSSAKPQCSGQTFEMCWDVESDPAPTVNAPVNAPAEASSANTDYGGQGCKGGFDMCWGDAQLGGDGDREGHVTAAPTTARLTQVGVNNSESPGSQDIQASLAPSSAPSEGSTITQVEAGEELLRRADNRLDRLSRHPECSRYTSWAFADIAPGAFCWCIRGNTGGKSGRLAFLGARSLVAGTFFGCLSCTTGDASLAALVRSQCWWLYHWRCTKVFQTSASFDTRRVGPGPEGAG